MASNKLAQTGYQLLEPSILPNAPTQVPSFGSYIDGVTTTIFAVAAVLAVLMIVIGGVQYMMSDSILAKDAGRSRIQSALIGLVILILIYLILNTINPNLLNLDAITNSVTPPAKQP